LTSSAGPRATALCALLIALLVSGCGGSGAKATDKPSKAVSTSVSPTPTPTPTAAPTAEPLSPFEDKAPVKAARAFASAAAKAVNDRDRSLTGVAPLTTSLGLSQTRDYYTKEDMAHGYLLPGPQPFTPVSVKVSGATAMLNLCMQTRGWALDRKTGKPAERRVVTPIVFQMRKVGGAWKLDRYQAGTADCAGITVRGVRW
jgi:hypothetical protein